jgi:hypothetical protein
MTNKISLLMVLFSILSSNQTLAESTQLDSAFERLTGTPLSLSHPKRSEWSKSWKSDPKSVLFDITGSVEFEMTTLLNFSSRLMNEENYPFLDTLDVSQIIVADQILKNGDFRDIFSDTVTSGQIVFSKAFVADKYSGDVKGLQLKTTLENGRLGILTSQSFALRNLSAGTNRRPVRAAFDRFLCTKIDQWKNPKLSDRFVGRDIDRYPGNNPSTYQNQCIGCHAPMDSLRGAWANFDLRGGKVFWQPRPHPKYSNNSSTYEGGFETKTDYWQNLLTQPENKIWFGWRGPMEGNGPVEFGRMVSESQRFQKCMVTRVVEEICPHTLSETLETKYKTEFTRIFENFRENHYKMRDLFVDIAMSQLCR